ncbi:hypothetical protein [Streptomyces sp. bgisy027]
MNQSISLRKSTPPSLSTAKQKSDRVVPLWEAARTQRLSGVAPSTGVSR